MKNNTIYALFFLPVLILAIVMGFYIRATRFNWVEVVVTGYDPKDFLSGFYMELQPNWEATDCTQFLNNQCPKDAFLSRYKFYIRREQSEKLTRAVNAGIVKLVFAYSHGHTPYVVDLLADGKSYIDYLADDAANNTTPEQIKTDNLPTERPVQSLHIHVR